MRDQKFPIYSFSAKWVQDGVHNPEYPRHHEGLPEGRIWDWTSFKQMFREEQTPEQLQAFLADWWKDYQSHKAELHPDQPELKAEFVERDSWVLTWFQHETLDTGQTDDEAICSFEDFVHRTEELNRQHRAKTGKDKHCLMGAEDRWRWHGADADGKPNDNAPAPCRCKFCKEQGKIRIAH